VHFKKFSMESSLVSQLNSNHLLRVNQTPNLQYILDVREKYEIQKNKATISLNLDNRKIEKEERQSWALDIENKRRASLDLETFSSYKAMQDFNEARETNNSSGDFEIDIDRDYLLNEGIQILSDYSIFDRNIYLSRAS